MFFHLSPQFLILKSYLEIFYNNLVKKITIIPLVLSNKTMDSNFSMTSTELGGAMSTFNEKYGHDVQQFSIFSYNTLGINNDCTDIILT